MIDPTSKTEHYRQLGYVPLRGLFPVEVLHAFYTQMQSDFAQQGRSMRAFAQRGPLLTRDAIEIYAYQYPPMLSFLWGLTPCIAAATNRVVLPTYAYFRLYRHGDVCRVHSDRYSCEHSLSLTVAYGEDRPWALSVATERTDPGSVITDDFRGQAFGSVEMQPGDAVLYQGVHHRHGRLDPNPNSWSAHLFLHWVDRDGVYAEHAFDRPAVENARRQQFQ